MQCYIETINDVNRKTDCSLHNKVPYCGHGTKVCMINKVGVVSQCIACSVPHYPLCFAMFKKK